MFPFLIENDLLGIEFISLTLAVPFRTLLGPLVGVPQTLVNEVVCQRGRVLIVSKVFMGFFDLLRLHSNVICNIFYKNCL